MKEQKILTFKWYYAELRRSENLSWLRTNKLSDFEKGTVNKIYADIEAYSKTKPKSRSAKAWQGVQNWFKDVHTQAEFEFKARQVAAFEAQYKALRQQQSATWLRSNFVAQIADMPTLVKWKVIMNKGTREPASGTSKAWLAVQPSSLAPAAANTSCLGSLGARSTPRLFFMRRILTAQNA